MRLLMLCGLCLGLLVGATTGARAQAAFQGIYVVYDPYDPTQLPMLQAAAAQPCPQDPANVQTPFCGAASGLLIRVNWCDFQLYHVANPAGGTYPSCHYQTAYSNGAGSPGIQSAATDSISPCPGAYDTCDQSILATSLQLVAQINASRAAAGLPPLQISIGLAAGYFTAQTVMDAVGFIDQPHNASQSGDPAQANCIRLPLPWKPAFATDYDATFDQLIGYVQAQLPGVTIAMAKVSGITATSMEMQMPGRNSIVKAPSDPGPAGPGALMSCSSTVNGAKTWLTAYNKTTIKGKTFSQAVESAFGTMLGHELAALANAGFPAAQLSIPNANGIVMSMVNCGSDGAGKCKVSTGNTGNWSIYYFQKYVNDLFSGGISATSAAAAWAAIRTDSFPLTPAGLAVNATSLSPTPFVSGQQNTCNINNQVPANAPVFPLNGVNVTELGSGTAIGWQTLFNSGSQCLAGSYGTTLANGINDGAQFIEIEPDAAFTDISACAQYLSPALTTLQSVVPPTMCQY